MLLTSCASLWTGQGTTLTPRCFQKKRGTHLHFNPKKPLSVLHESEGRGTVVEKGPNRLSSTSKGSLVVKESSGIKGRWPIQSDTNLAISSQHSSQPTITAGHVQIVVQYIPPQSPARFSFKQGVDTWELVWIQVETHGACSIHHFSNLI